MRENKEVYQIVLNENNESNFFECLATPYSEFILLFLKITNPLIRIINKG